MVNTCTEEQSMEILKFGRKLFTYNWLYLAIALKQVYSCEVEEMVTDVVHLREEGQGIDSSNYSVSSAYF